MRTPCVAAALSASLVSLAALSLAPRAARADEPLEGAQAPASTSDEPASSVSSDLQASAPAASKPRGFTLTMQPGLLVNDVIELTGEQRMSERFSLAWIAAIGRPTSSSGERYDFADVGGQIRYYFKGGFAGGFNAAAQLLAVAGSNSSGSDTRTAGGLQAAALLGYKLTLEAGLSFDLQAGAQLLAIRGSRDASSEDDGSVELAPITRLSLGWTF